MLRSESILKELEEIEPGIPWPERFPEFNVPKGYFEGLYESVMTKTGKIDAEISPLHVVRQPFSAPDSYFDTLPSKILGRIKQEEKRSPVIKLPNRKHRIGWAAAAVIAAFLAVSGLLSIPRYQPGPSNSISLSKQLALLSDQAIEQYLDVNLNSANMNEVYNNLSNEDLQNVLTKGLSTRAIEEYLQDNVPDSLSF